jgi:hypothetical protein
MRAIAKSGFDYKAIGENVPGVCPGGKLELSASYENLMIPARDHQGRIVGLRMRRNEPDASGNRYYWLTSKNGPSPGAPCHLSRPMAGCETDSAALRITEGELKADITSNRTGVKTLSIPGVTSWRKALPIIDELKPARVILSLDMDAATNPAVGAAVVRLWDELAQRTGLTATVETWDAAHKGIDDALAAEAEVTGLAAFEAIAYVNSLRSDATSEANVIDASGLDPMEGFETPTPSGDKPESKPYFRPISAAELDAGEFNLNYLIPGVVCESQPLIIAGQFKTLKTSIAFDVAVSIASGTPFLNTFDVPETRKVMVLTAESGMATVQETCRRICRSRGFRLGNVGGLYFDDRVPRLDNPVHGAELVKVLKDREIKVLIADPAYLMIDGADAGNLFNMGDQLKTFAEIANAAGATPVLLHHAKKNNLNAGDYQPLELADLAWSGFAEFARQWLLLSRRERYVEGSGRHCLWLSAGGSAGHNGCWAIDIDEGHPDDMGGRRWDAAVDQAQDARAKSAQEAAERREAQRQEKELRAMEANREKVRAAFRGNKQLTMKQIRERGGINTSAAASVTAYMIRIGELIPCGQVTAGNGQKYDGYELNYEAEN